MKKKIIIGLMAIVAIVATVIFAVCIEEKTPTKVPETTLPEETLPSISEPKYSRGDLLRAEGQSSEYAYLILNYDENKYDKYQMYQTTIVQLVSDKWTYTEKPKEWDDRDYIERTLGTIKINHIDPATVASPAPKYHRGDVIMGTAHLYVILDYNQTTDEYKTTLVQDTDALGLCYLAREESSYFARWQSREYLEKYNVLFVHDHVDPSNIKSAKEYYRKYGY